ncbi:cation diffusion facilitator family transporter [Rothia mucilaginosa]|uniref:Cation transporter n=1 Tax=Rothia mucilaginosa TaxID=43675 RepID=A0A943Y608_9MICC|nr:cation diffusion facilitator family transporter [Rothia mucilaginosa]MBS6635063.1 cation transporter [Rothia mucilaginosa]
MGEYAHAHHDGHHHNHSHVPSPEDAASMRPRLLVAFSLAVIIVLAQAVGSLVTGSLALLTDTAHAITDASGLLVALTAASLMTRPATSRHTWGFRRIEVLAALGQSVLLLAVGIYAAVEGVHRLFAAPEVPGAELLVFGVVGLVANVVGVVVLASGRNANFNMRAAFLEVLNDALGSLGVIVAAVVIWLTGFYRADALAGLFIAALIVPRAVRLMKQTTAVLMEFTPDGLDLDAMREHILSVDGVVEVHDVHASMVATGLPVVTAHVVVDDACFRDGSAVVILGRIRSCVATHFKVSVEHSTFQLETAELGGQEPQSVRHP